MLAEGTRASAPLAARGIPGIAVLVGATLLGIVPGARATGFTDLGDDVRGSGDTRVAIEGALRLRGARLVNLDLDRGSTPSGELLFPVSLSEPDRQALYGADMRLRTDLALFAPGGVLGAKLRVDVLDNVALGASADGIPGGTLTQEPAEAAFRIKRAYGELVTPLGYLAAGRMGNDWGLGMLANGGDCVDCDSGDAADRIVYAAPVLGHIWAFAYDLSATGWTVPRRDERRAVDLEPSARVQSLAAGVLRWRTPLSRRRRAAAGRTTVDYGLYYAHRWQDRDVPAAYLPTAEPVEVDAAQVLRRDLSAHAIDGWVRFEHPWLRVELEVAWVTARVGQASNLPGFELPGAVRSSQLGAALESRLGPRDARLRGGLDLGFASGDPAPGFGARPPLQDLTPPVPGDLDGPQAMPPGDMDVDNFRFHPDYRIDRILFREIVGTVTDALYARPHLELTLVDLGRGSLDLGFAAVLSATPTKASAPGLAHPLGVELDPTLAWTTDAGFSARLELAFLFPLEGLDNVGAGLEADHPDAGLKARPAHLTRLHLGYRF